MHYLSLEMKRAHWAVVKFAKPIAAEFWLTPARFDLLYVVRRFRGCDGQAAIARRLGVSDATVSRMLDSLEELGWIRRTRPLNDRRRKIVSLTKWATELLDRAIRAIVGAKVMHHVYQAMHLLGVDARYAVTCAKTNDDARRAYEKARREERLRVFREMETFFEELQSTSDRLRGTTTPHVYDPPDRMD